MTITNKAAVIEEPGKLVVKEIPIPNAKDDSIVTKNALAGVNFADNSQVSGELSVTNSNILGFEGAGEVVQVGKNVTQFKAGDRIINTSGSTYAEYTEIHSSSFSRLTKLPDDISYETAVGLGAQALTAYTLAFKEYPVQKDDYLVVHAAAGGVGVILVQLLSNLGGKVIATVSSDEKASIAKNFGAQYTIDYTKENIVDRVKEITNGKGAHAVYDSVGKTVIDASLESLRPFGVYINYGEASGKCDIPMTQLIRVNCLRIHGSMVLAYQKEGDTVNEWWLKLFDMVKSGEIKVYSSKTYPLDRTQDALDDIKSRKTTGKLLIKI